MTGTRGIAAAQPRVGRAARLALLLAGLCLMPAGAARLLEEGFSIDYNVSRNGLDLGITRRDLRPGVGGQLEFSSHTQAEGMVRLVVRDIVKEHSILQIRDGQVLPTQYSYQRSGGRKERTYGLNFDWPRQELLFTETKVSVPLQRGTQDTLSFVAQVMLKLQGGEHSFSMPIASRKRVRHYRVESLGTEVLATAIGPVPVLHLKAEAIGRDTSYELWCSQGHEFLPLKLLKIDADETIELTVRSLRVGQPTAAGKADG